MSFKIRFALSAMAVLFSWQCFGQRKLDHQSVSQEIGHIDDSGCLQAASDIRQ